MVENRGGAGGLLAVEQVARAPADGRTILFASVGAFVITNALKPQPGYDQLKMFAPVARIGAAPTLFIVKADWPFKTLPELIAKAKSDSKMSYGSAGAGTTMHIAAEQLKSRPARRSPTCRIAASRRRSTTSWAGTSISSTATSRCSIRW